MAEPPSPPPEQPFPETDALQYWCYHCEKRVSIETQPDVPDILCCECKHGFVESIASPSLAPPSATSDLIDDPHFGSQFLRVLRLLAESARDDDAPPPPPRNHSSGDDFLRVELDDWDDDEESSNNNNNDEDDEDDGVEFHDEGEEEHEGNEEHQDRLGGEDPSGDEAEEDMRRRSMRNRIRDLTSRIRDLATGTRRIRRNRILDWADILMGLEDNSIELRLQVPDSDRFFGNPGDYVDAADYEALLLTMAESDGSGRRGAPPAAKSAVESLPTVEIVSEDQALVCAICKDMVGVGNMAKRLPCGHQYHGDCIVPWLGSRNSCPVCRFELPTDDQEYEEEKKKRVTATPANGASGSGETDTVSG